MFFLLLIFVFCSAKNNERCFLGNMNQEICASVGSITSCYGQTAAMANAANSALSHGGGLAGAISRAAGPSVQAESTALIQRLGHQIATGETAVTLAGNLSVREIIHVVGPMYGRQSPAESKRLLRLAIANLLRTARLACDDVVYLPPISAGIFRYPLQEAIDVIYAAILDYFLFMYDDPVLGHLNEVTVAADLPKGRFVDRTPCNASSANTFWPSKVVLVAWSQKPSEVQVVNAVYDRIEAEEAMRRQAHNGSTYTIMPTFEPTVPPTFPTPSPTLAPTSARTHADSSAAPSSASTKTGKATTSMTNDKKIVPTSTSQVLEYCLDGPIPFPCWTLALVTAVLLFCALLLMCSCCMHSASSTLASNTTSYTRLHEAGAEPDWGK